MIGISIRSVGKVLALSISLISISMADIHPGLKNAVDNGDVKSAKALVEKIGVKDIYCPSSLSLNDALKIYGNVFSEKPAAMWENCEGGFIENAEKDVCKVSEPLCKYYLQNCDFDALKIGLMDVNKAKLNIKKVNRKTQKEEFVKATKQECFDELEKDGAVAKAKLFVLKKTFCDPKDEFSTAFCPVFYLTVEDSIQKARIKAEKKCKTKPKKKVIKEVEASVEVNPFLYEIELLGIGISREMRNPVNFDSSMLDLYKALKKNNIIDISSKLRLANDIAMPIISRSRPVIYGDDADGKRSFANVSFAAACLAYPNFDSLFNSNRILVEMYNLKRSCKDSVEKDVGYLALTSTKADLIKGIVAHYAKWGNVSDSIKAFSCRLYPKIDEEIAKIMSVNLFNCVSLSEFKDANEKCSQSDSAYIWKSSANLSYACENKRLRGTSIIEDELGMLCTERYNEFFNGKYVCENGSWRLQTAEEHATNLICKQDHQGLIVKEYICDEGRWRRLSSEEQSTGKICDSEMDGKVIDEYLCQNGQWKKASPGEKEAKKMCKADNQGEFTRGYVCDDGQWRETNEAEERTKKLCTKNNQNEVVGEWVCWNTINWRGQKLYLWREAFQGEIQTKKVCSSNNKGEKKNGYYCDKIAGWIKDRNYGTMTDSRDGKKYRTTKIGKQEWMAENINFKPQEKTYCYGNKEENCKLYGRLYPASTAMQKACPEGWRIPTIEEVKDLFKFVGGAKNTGKVLKSQMVGGSDDYGFSVVLSGYWQTGHFELSDYEGYFWTSSVYERRYQGYAKFSREKGSAETEWDEKYRAFPVRCIKD